MSLFYQCLFPVNARSFTGQRWINIVLRTLHLIGVAGVGGAYLYNLAASDWYPYMILTLLSGGLMVLIEIWSNGIWLVQLRGISTLLKIIILSMTFFVGLHPYLLLSVIVIAGLISHAPGKLRYYSFITQNN